MDHGGFNFAIHPTESLSFTMLSYKNVEKERAEKKMTE
jgi:hypothetical protein